MRIMFGNEEISVANHEFLKESQFENMIDAVEAMQILDYYSIEKLLYLEDKYGLETEDMVNIIGYSLGVESLNIPINVYNYELINELGGGLEGLPTDIIKMGWRATKGTVKAVHKAHKTVYKGAKQLSSKWNTNIKPLIMKFLKEFQSQLQIMWGKFRKYDKLYTKLGKEINSVTQVYGKQMNSMRAVSIFYHKFNPNALKGYAEAIKDYDAFMGAITGSTELFGGKFVPPKEFANYLRSKNIAKAKECVDSMSAGMSKLNSRGDLAFAYAIINDSDKNISKSNFRKIRECFTGPEPEQILKAAIKNKSPLVEFVQVSILRKEIEGKYNEKDVNKFKNDMLGNAGFLTIMSSILNNQIIEKVLNGGGKSIKEQTREDMSAMEEIVRSGVSEQQNTATNSNQVDAEKEEKARQSAEVTGNNGNTKGTTLEQEVKNAEGNTKAMQSGNQSEEFNPFGYQVGTEGLEGTEGLFDFFKSKKKEPEIKNIKIKDLNNIKLHMKKIYDKIYSETLAEAKKLYPPKIVKSFYLHKNDEYNDYPSTSRATKITFQDFQFGAQSFIGELDEISIDEWDNISKKMYDIVEQLIDKYKVEEINGIKFEWEVDDVCVRAESIDKYQISDEELGNESYDNYFSNFFDQSTFTDGTEAGLAEAMGYDADNKQKSEAKAASTDKISSDPNNGEMGLAELADAYIQSYSILMSKATAAYSSMVKGFLAATFVLCKEADIIVKEIYSSTGANRNATNEAVNQDRPEQDDFDNEE